MNGHHIVGFIKPALVACDRCSEILDVYQWSEPCKAETEEIAADGDAADGRGRQPECRVGHRREPLSAARAAWA